MTRWLVWLDRVVEALVEDCLALPIQRERVDRLLVP